jgi:hypothetical protein
MNQRPPLAAAMGSGAVPCRYYAVTREGAVSGYEVLEAAIAAARTLGEGTDIVDTLATPYFPMVQRIEKGEPIYVEYGAWPTRTSPEQNLIEAAKKGYPPILRAFLARGPDINGRDTRGSTALMWAVASRVPENVRILIEAGSALDARDRDGVTALKLARAKGLTEIAELLLRAGARE